VNLAPVPTVLVSLLEQDVYYRVGALVDLACNNSRVALESVSYRRIQSVLSASEDAAEGRSGGGEALFATRMLTAIVHP
jgi:hypothetical protein